MEKLLTKKELAKLKTAANNSISLAFDMVESVLESAVNELLAHEIDKVVGIMPSGDQIPVTPADKTSGIILLALGHAYYGEMAANLAGSIRYSDKDIPIHLVYHGNALDHLGQDKLRLFTSIAQAPAESFTKGGKTAYFKAKTYLYDLSPYDKTLYLDVDMILFGNRRASDFIAALDGVDFAIQNRDAIELSSIKEGDKPPFYLWADVASIKKAYDLTSGKLYGLHSELMYFEKNPKMEAFFNEVKEIYERPKMEAREFAGDIADELAFAVAMLKTGVKPHVEPYSPVYWRKLDGRNGVPHRINDLGAKFFAYSVGGNVQPPQMVDIYNLMARAYMRAVGVSRVWALKNKKNFIKERQSL